MTKTLRDAKVGDFAMVKSWNKEEAVYKKVTIKRLNTKSITTDDGTRWDYNTQMEVGDPGVGRATRIELWDDEVHPYLKDADKTRKPINQLCNNKPTPKKLASILHLLEEALKGEQS
jgi:hypothetical protein